MPQKGFIGALFDMSFDEFITPKLIKVLYILLLVLIALGLVVGMIGGLITLFDDFITGAMILIGTPIVTILYIISARVGMEMTIVLFRIAENIATIAHRERM